MGGSPYFNRVALGKQALLLSELFRGDTLLSPPYSSCQKLAAANRAGNYVSKVLLPDKFSYSSFIPVSEAL